MVEQCKVTFLIDCKFNKSLPSTYEDVIFSSNSAIWKGKNEWNETTILLICSVRLAFVFSSHFFLFSCFLFAFLAFHSVCACTVTSAICSSGTKVRSGIRTVYCSSRSAMTRSCSVFSSSSDSSSDSASDSSLSSSLLDNSFPLLVLFCVK